jgi:hypothetical protein
MTNSNTPKNIYVHNFLVFNYKGQMLAMIQPNYVPAPEQGDSFIVQEQNFDEEPTLRKFVFEQFLCSISNSMVQLWEVSEGKADEDL